MLAAHMTQLQRRESDFNELLPLHSVSVGTRPGLTETGGHVGRAAPGPPSETTSDSKQGKEFTKNSYIHMFLKTCLQNQQNELET